MKYIIRALCISFVVFCSSYTQANVLIDGSSDFKRKVNFYLNDAKNSSIYLKELVKTAANSSRTIRITPITDNPSTWHANGKKSRSHTEALDSQRRGTERNTSTNSVIYINENRITLNHKTYKSGTLIHELVHALDLANGKYHRDYSIREKRAVFFQNIWRQSHGKKLRSDYHGRFKTLEYQNAVASGKVKQFVKHYFVNNDLP